MTKKELIEHCVNHAENGFPRTAIVMAVGETNLAADKVIQQLEARVKELAGLVMWEHCSDCEDKGFIAVGGYPQEQCEFCYTYSKSVFNKKRLTGEL